ncbi:MAG TPA: peptidylprolyl isomerase [Candidatus Babeliales bacterium]|jgi:peptidyl-prolyl cis-trans isomerase SurA|nr:peptidylprolyl isomerase [Candidatus Babeliales bacterium]
MKVKIIIFLMISSFLTAQTDDEVNTADLVLLDQIEVAVYGQEDVEIITKSDIDRPSLGGGFRSKEDIVFEKEVLLDAKKHHIPQDEEAIDAYLAQMQREHGLSSAQLEEIFTSAGYTIEEGREQLQMMNVMNTMLDIKIRSNLIIPRKDVEEYYKNHPTIIEATYTLQRAFVPQSDRMSDKQQYKVLMRYAQTGKGASGVVWSDSFTINHADIATSKQFIYDMEIGQVSEPYAMNGGFEMFKLVDKTPETVKSLEESYREIVDILRRPKYEELMEKYREMLMKNAAVVYF